MSLTTQYVQDSRQIIAGVEAAAVTSPDLPRPDAAVLITRSTEMLRTMADHAEGLEQALTELRAENAELREGNAELGEESPAAHFQVVTDTGIYTRGESTDALKSLGHENAVLEGFKEVGDWIELTFSGGLKISMPESRIQYVAETADES